MNVLTYMSLLKKFLFQNVKKQFLSGLLNSLVNRI